MAIAPPWVNFKLYTTAQVGSTPTLVFGSQQACIIDEVQITNTIQEKILVDITILREDGINYFFLKQQPINVYGIVNVLKGSVLYLEPGDLLYANSDFSGNLFDCLVSYRQLNEL